MELWNKLLLDPWRRIRVVDYEVLIDALVSFRVRQQRETVVKEPNHVD